MSGALTWAFAAKDGAGDRDRTGMTNLEDRWHGRSLTCAEVGPGRRLGIPVNHRDYPRITLVHGTGVARLRNRLAPHPCGHCGTSYSHGLLANYLAKSPWAR